MHYLSDFAQNPTARQPTARMSRRKLLRNALIGGAIGAIGISTAGDFLSPYQGAPAASPTVVARWNSVALHAISATHLGPPMVARALAILHTCIYDAWCAYQSTAIPTQAVGISQAIGIGSKAEAISFAAYRALLDIFPTQATFFTNVMTDLGYAPRNISTDRTTSAGIGNHCAQAVIAFCHSDRANQQHGYQDTTEYPNAYGDYPAVSLPMNSTLLLSEISHELLTSPY